MLDTCSLISIRRGCSGWRRANAKQRAYQVRATPGGGEGINDKLSHPIRVDEHSLGHTKVQNDHAQQIVEIMCHPTGQIADRFHFLRLHKLALQSTAAR